MAQPQVRFKAVGLGGFDQRVDQGTGVRTGGGVGEQPGLAPDDEGADGILGGIIVEGQIAAFEIADQARPLLMEVAERFAQRPCRAGRWGGRRPARCGIR